MTPIWRFVHRGLVPITILMGAAVGAGGFGPLSIPPKWSQSPGHACFPADICTEFKPATKASHIASISAVLPGLEKTKTPTAEPTPDQTHDNAFHFDWLRRFVIEPPKALGSGPSPSTYMAASVSGNPDNSLIKRGLSACGIDRGVLNFSRASWASAARAFASDMLFSVASLYRENSSAAATASAFWSRITTYVDTPTITAASAPNASDATTILFQESNPNPNIRLFPLETVALTICAIACLALAVLGFTAVARISIWASLALGAILAGIVGIFPALRRCIL